MPAWAEAILIGLLGKVVLPIANAVGGVIGKQAPKWLASFRRFVRRKQLQLRVDHNDVAILASIRGRQMDYAHVQSELAGRLEGDALLRAVTALQASGLLNRPRLSQPPDPHSLLTASADADLVLNSKRRARRPRPRRKDITEAASRRAAIHESRLWLQQYDADAREFAYLSADRMEEASVHRAQLARDEDWLAAHGFGGD